MKLTLDYNTDTNGYNLSADLDIDIAKDAEALGYALGLTTAIQAFIQTLTENVAPEYRARVWQGMKAVDKEMENNKTWPFDQTKITTRP